MCYDASDLDEGMVELIPLLRSLSGQTGIFVAKPGIAGIPESPPASLLSMLPDGANSRKKVHIVLIELESDEWARMRSLSRSSKVALVQIHPEGLVPRAGGLRKVVARGPLADWVRIAAEESSDAFITGDENASSARVTRPTSRQEATRAQEQLRRVQAVAQQHRGKPAPERRRLDRAGRGGAVRGQMPRGSRRTSWNLVSGGGPPVTQQPDQPAPLGNP